MNPPRSSVKRILEQSPVKASAPCRIDTGGTWDIKAMALPFEKINPITVNIALSLRTRVTLRPYRSGKVKITSTGFSKGEEYSIDDLPLNTPFGIFLAAVGYFRYHGLEVVITSDSPVKSALGGSSTALIALIKSLSKLDSLANRKKGLTKRDILHLGYHLEDGISGGNCGIQDQAAAVYGGVNLWTWRYSNRGAIFKRDPLLDKKGMGELSDHIVTVYSGKSHVSARTNQLWLKDFLSGKTRKGWLEANKIVKGFTEALKGKDWATAANFLMEEMRIRRRITPDALIPITDRLIKMAEKTGCGARFAGAGAGGSVWAIGEADQINKLIKKWSNLIEHVKGASILDCRVDPKGVK